MIGSGSGKARIIALPPLEERSFFRNNRSSRSSRTGRRGEAAENSGKIKISKKHLDRRTRFLVVDNPVNKIVNNHVQAVRMGAQT